MKVGWQTKRLSDVCEIVMGQSPAGESYNTIGEGVPLINGPVEFSQDSFGMTVRSKFTTQPTKLCKEGDLILCVRGSTTGRMNIAGFDACIGRGVASIRAKQYQPWINHFIASIRDEIHGKGTGATFPNVSGAMLNGLEIAMPPLPEQKRIVNILDASFEGIATAKTNAERNLQNARALFESHLQSVFTQRGEGWVDMTLADTCEVFADGDWVESKDQAPEGIRLIQTGNVGVGVFKDRAEKARYISEATFKRLRCTEIFEGDCLISRLPDPAGRSCLLPNTGERMITAVDCTIIRFNRNQVNPAYFNYYSQSSTYLSAVDSETTGTTRKRISRSKLGMVSIPVAPLTDQQRIVAKLDFLNQETQRLESIYQQKLTALDDLKKSLLNQAFSGEL